MEEILDINDALDRSIVVSAHPDDEALWFSSVLDEVNELVICYLGIPSKPAITEGRCRCIEQYPLKNASFLGITESEASTLVNWRRLERTESGIKIDQRKAEARKYDENYHTLLETLRNHLRSRRNVFTHNPWGEYGHADHVQVYRAVKSLQKEMGFRIWCSNYCSDITLALMSKYILSCNSNYVTLRVNEDVANELRDLYIRNGCWTWYDGWKWFREESFMEDTWFYSTESGRGVGHLFPINMMKMPQSRNGSQLRKLVRRVLEAKII